MGYGIVNLKRIIPSTLGAAILIAALATSGCAGTAPDGNGAGNTGTTGNAGTAGAPDRENSRDLADRADYTARLDRIIPQLLERYDVPGLAIALIQDGQPVWSGAYGYADREDRRPMTVDTVCRAESISKSVTAWGVMKLVESGDVALSTSITELLPRGIIQGSTFDESEITVAMLLSNSSGLPLGTIGPPTEYEPGSEVPTPETFLSPDARLVRPPGSGFLYSDVGFNLLQLVVREASGRPFHDYMHTQVLAPLEMAASDFEWRSTYVNSIATGYELDGDPVEPYVYPAAASGGLFSTTRDLARFVAAEIRSDSPAIDEMHTARVEIPGLFGFVADSYGFGHFIETLPDGRTAVWHGGQGHGWMTHFHAVPESGDGIVIVTNSQRSWPLMAEVLSEWSRWAGLGSVQFSRVVHASTAVTVLTAVVLVLAATHIVGLARGLQTGRRRWYRFRDGPVLGRVIRIFAGLGLAVILVQRIAAPYVFESSIFPTLVGWMAAAVVVLALALIGSGVLPLRGTVERSRVPPQRHRD